jgi:hypothetical protein
MEQQAANNEPVVTVGLRYQLLAFVIPFGAFVSEILFFENDGFAEVAVRHPIEAQELRHWARKFIQVNAAILALECAHVALVLYLYHRHMGKYKGSSTVRVHYAALRFWVMDVPTVYFLLMSAKYSNGGLSAWGDNSAFWASVQPLSFIVMVAMHAMRLSKSKKVGPTDDEPEHGATEQCLDSCSQLAGFLAFVFFLPGVAIIVELLLLRFATRAERTSHWSGFDDLEIAATPGILFRSPKARKNKVAKTRVLHVGARRVNM